MFNSLQPNELHHFGLLWPPLSPRVWSNSGPLSQWCFLTMSSSVVPFSFCLQFSQHQGFSNESALCIRWPKYWSFSFSITLSNEYSGLISFRIDWFDLVAVQGTLKSLLQHQGTLKTLLHFQSINSSALSFLYGPTLTWLLEKTIALTRWTLTRLKSA